MEQIRQVGDDAGGQTFVVVFFLPLFAFEPDGGAADFSSGEDVFAKRVADGNAPIGRGAGGFYALLPDGRVGLTHTDYGTLDDSGEEVGKPVAAEHCRDVAVEIGDQYEAIAALLERLQHRAALVDMVPGGGIAMVGDGSGEEGGALIGEVEDVVVSEIV